MPLSFDDLVDPFERGRGLPPEALRAFAALVKELTGDRDEARILEPGVGNGRLALPLLLSGCRVAGVDISRPMLDRLAARISALPGPCELVLGSATALPFASASFDLGYAASLFYLIPEWRRALDELARVVKPGGFVLFCRERSDLSPELARFDAAWRELAEATGFHHQAEAVDDAIVIRAMDARIGPVKSRKLAAWTIGQTVAEALDGYGARLRPLYATIPAPAWDETVAAFVVWAREAFLDPTTRLDCQVSFEVAIARVS